MDIQKRIINHTKRWNISVDEENQFSQLRNRVIKVINDFLSDLLTNEQQIDKQFREILDNFLGEEIELKRNLRRSDTFLSTSLGASFSKLQETIQQGQISSTDTNKYFGDTHVYREIKRCKNIEQLATALQALFLVLEDVNKYIPLDKLVKELREVVKLSPNTGFHITLNQKRVILYPPGAKLLDEGVVNDVLEWLEKYPKVAKPFEKALKFYAEGDKNKYRDLLDNLRFSIEQLLKEILNNDKSLEKQQEELLPWLSKRRKHRQIINLYQQLLFGQYCAYQNEAVKHNEALFSEDEVEFMIYLTGTFIRFLIQPKTSA